MSNSVQRHPKKVYVELTTRCNLQCQMCVKYAAGSCIPEADMSLSLFTKLCPSLGDAEILILNGIGESLLHPDLVEIITLARKSMPAGAVIGLQSNGLLLNYEYIQNLLDAGLTTLCLSVDGFDGDSLNNKGQHSFTAVKRAVKSFVEAKETVGREAELGLEIVLTEKNADDLPGLVRWAIDNGIDYILTSHLFLYDEAAESENLFNPHSLGALELYTKYQKIAHSMGLDLVAELHNFRRHAGTQATEPFSKLLTSIIDEAKSKDIRINFTDLLFKKTQRRKEVQEILEKVEEIADTGGLELFIPPLQAISPRECRFMTENTTFIAVNGDVMPCHFLWHTYSCRVLKGEVKVTKRPFGNIAESPLNEIWQNKEYSSFREEAKEYNYTPCWTCSQGPCASLVNDEGGYANDCYGSQVPCGHCQWSLGGIRCL